MKITSNINGHEVIIEGSVEEVSELLDEIKEDDQNELVNKEEDNVEQEKNPLNLVDDKIYYIKPLRNKDDKVSNDSNKSELKIENLKNGTYFIEGKIEDQFGDFVQNENIEITNKIDEGLVRINSEDNLRPVVVKIDDFEEQLKNVKLTLKSEKERKFEQGDLVEVIESFGGVEEGNYGIVTCYDEGNARNIYLAGYDKFGTFSKGWINSVDGVKLIKK